MTATPAATPAVCCCSCRRCLYRAVWRVTTMCIHEHLWVLEFCAKCFVDERIADEPGGCGDCFDEQHAKDPETGVWVSIGVGPLSHECPLGPPIIERIADEPGGGT